MPLRINWSPLAEQDFSRILEYLSDKWDDPVAYKFIGITDSLILQISKNPNQFPLINKKKRIRKCVLTKHNTLFYRTSRDQIDILRIFYSRQDPGKLKL